MRSLLTYLSRSFEQYPDKIAVRHKTATLSYRDLDKKSSQLASLLIQEGLTAGERVGLYLDKSPEAIVAIFGVLKAGSCYVPLDPIAPEQRLEMIVDDCRPEWVITGKPKLPVIRGIATRLKSVKHLVVIDTARSEGRENSSDIQVFFQDDLARASAAAVEVARQVDHRDLAYILYTSGSTGQPKGVMISHGAACAFIDWARNTFQIESSDVLSAHAPLHFDLSIFDIFAAVAAGATICLVPQGWSTFPKTIAEFIGKNGITTWYSVPTALVQLVMHGDLEQWDYPELKRILFAGEVFPSKYLRQLMQLLPEVDYFNLYGPTETNVITCYQVKEPPAAEEVVPIGTLCNDVTGYMVSEDGTLSSRGEIGELYVKGPTLMDGYWGDDRKTSEALIEDPFEQKDTSPVYKTGDLVHQDRNGMLIYHGRRDSMIKSRGYRIELGEIETVLNAHPNIKESIVAALPSEEFGTTVAAILVARSDTDLAEEDIYRFCKEKLPAYMIPEQIRFIDALPRTSTGKIDRQTVAESIL